MSGREQQIDTHKENRRLEMQEEKGKLEDLQRRISAIMEHL
jgi:hypothetical protein